MKYFTLNGQRIDVEINPVLIETLDETLDNCTVSFFSDIANPFAPFLPLNLEEDGQVISALVVSLDKVEIVSSKPIKYKHTITAKQRHQLLTTQLMRNSVFSADLNGSKGFRATATSFSQLKTIIDDGSLTDESFTIHGYGIGQYYALVNSYKLSVYSGSIDLSKVDLTKPYHFNITFESSRMDTISYVERPAPQTYIYEITTSQYEDNRFNHIAENMLNQTLPNLYLTHKIGDEIQDTRTINLNDYFSDITSGDELVLTGEDKLWLEEKTEGVIEFQVSKTSEPILRPNGFRWEDGENIPNKLYFRVNFSTEFLKLNVYQVLQTIIKRQQHSYNGQSEEPLFNLPTEGELYDLLTSTNAPNFVFTQSTVFDAIADIFRLFDATFTIDENNTLQIEYFNEHKPINKPNISGRSSSLSEDKYVNKIVSYFQNTQITDKFPNTTRENVLTNVRSKSIGVPAESDFVFMLPKPIFMLNSVKVSIGKLIAESRFPVWSFNDTTGVTTEQTVLFLGDKAEYIDITDYIVESSLYNLLDPREFHIDTDYNKLTMQNTLHYSMGSNYIECATVYTTNTGLRNAIIQNVIKSAIKSQYGYELPVSYPTWKDIKFAVDYIALADGKLEIERLENNFNGSMLVNQSNGSIDIYKLGLNMVGLGLKLGNMTLTMTQTFTNWNDRVKKGEYFVDENGKWVANVCNYTFFNNDTIQATIEFVKNFNSLATRIQLNSEKRLTNISNDLTMKCEDNLGEYIYFTTSQDFQSQKISLNDDILSTISACFGQYAKNDTKSIEYALIKPLTEEGKSYFVNGGEVKNVIVPMLHYVSGNSLCLEMSFDSPNNAGNQMLITERYRGFVADSSYFSRPVWYCSELGEADLFDINFISLTNGEVTNYYPELRDSNGRYEEENTDFVSLGKINHFGYYKKANEIFALNYQLHFLPNPNEINDTFLGTEFYQRLTNGLNVGKLYFYHSLARDNFKYSILDTEGFLGTQSTPTSYIQAIKYPVSINNVRLTDITNKGSILEITFSIPLSTRVNTWAICDENGKILVAHNESETVTSRFYKINFYTRHTRR